MGGSGPDSGPDSINEFRRGAKGARATAFAATLAETLAIFAEADPIIKYIMI
jgi:hypothetical protein